MSMSKFKIGSTLRLALALCLAFAVALAAIGISRAASTSKSLSTNFTLVNFSSSLANVTVQYVKDDGGTWTADAANTSFTIPANGSYQIRQYFDAVLSSGRGSAVVSSDQPLGAVSQILARGQTPTSGAYSAFSQGGTTFYVPLVSRRGATSTGMANSQIMIQNTGNASVNVTVDLLASAGTPASLSKPINNIPVGATHYYDLDDETGLNPNWFGSATVSVNGAGTIAVISNFFTGADGMQTFNAFPASSLGTGWLAPLVTARLSNGLSTVITVQNLSGGSMAQNSVQLSCKRDASSPGPATLNITNGSAIANNGSFSFNPVIDLTNFPTGWFGACRVTTPGNSVVFVQMRYVNQPFANAAAYEGINASGTDKKVLVPLVAKRLSNSFATTVTIQNLSASQDASVTFTYTPNPIDCGSVCTGQFANPVVVGPFNIPPDSSCQHNHRQPSTSCAGAALNLPDGWVGSLSVSSTTTPIAGFVQLTYIGGAGQVGDTFMAHNGFTQP
jgi:hypothetical protein